MTPATSAQSLDEDHAPGKLPIPTCHCLRDSRSLQGCGRLERVCFIEPACGDRGRRTLARSLQLRGRSGATGGRLNSGLRSVRRRSCSMNWTPDTAAKKLLVHIPSISQLDLGCLQDLWNSRENWGRLRSVTSCVADAFIARDPAGDRP